MIKWIIILLIVAAVASLLGLNSLAGAAATAAHREIAALTRRDADGDFFYDC